MLNNNLNRHAMRNTFLANKRKGQGVQDWFITHFGLYFGSKDDISSWHGGPYAYSKNDRLEPAKEWGAFIGITAMIVILGLVLIL